MTKKLRYIIIPNFILFEKFKNKTSMDIFNDKSLEWKEVPQISGYWNELTELSVYTSKSLIKKLRRIVDETALIPCDYNNERLFLYSNLYCQLKMGETLYVQYTNDK